MMMEIAVEIVVEIAVKAIVKSSWHSTVSYTIGLPNVKPSAHVQVCCSLHPIAPKLISYFYLLLIYSPTSLNQLITHFLFYSFILSSAILGAKTLIIELLANQNSTSDFSRRQDFRYLDLRTHS